MTNIIFINGPCGIGKSMVFEKIHEHIPFSFLFHRDAERRKFSQYKKDSETYAESGKLVNKLLLGAIHTAIQNDFSLIIDAVFVDENVIQKIAKTVEAQGGEFLHFCLMAEKSAWEQRIKARGFIPGLLTPERAEQFYNEVYYLAQNIDMIEIDTTKKSPEAVLQEVMRNIYKK